MHCSLKCCGVREWALTHRLLCTARTSVFALSFILCLYLYIILIVPLSLLLKMLAVVPSLWKVAVGQAEGQKLGYWWGFVARDWWEAHFVCDSVCMSTF